MKVEEYKKRIMEETGLTRKEIQNLVEEKKNELKGLISEEGALFIISKELGLDIKMETKEITPIYLVDVISKQLKNLTVVGRISRIYESRIFNRKDGSTGKVMNFKISDKTEVARVVVWDNWVDRLIEQTDFKLGNLIKIVNCYTKWSDYSNEHEIVVGKWSKIMLNPEVSNEDEYPEVEDTWEDF